MAISSAIVSALPVHAFGDRRHDVVSADSLPVPGRLQDDRGIPRDLHQARQDLRLVAADQRRLFEGRADGLLGRAEPGAVQALLAHPHAGDSALLSQQLLGAFPRYPADLAPHADIIAGWRPDTVLDLADS